MNKTTELVLRIHAVQELKIARKWIGEAIDIMAEEQLKTIRTKTKREHARVFDLLSATDGKLETITRMICNGNV
mgnify:CR=1 FL=1